MWFWLFVWTPAVVVVSWAVWVKYMPASVKAWARGILGVE